MTVSWSNCRGRPPYGDLAANAATVLAKPAGKTPKALAAAIAEKLRLVADIAAVERISIIPVIP